MDHADIEEHQVALRYVLGQLSPREIDLFEEHYLDCPKCFEEVELISRFDRAMKATAAEDAGRVAAVGILTALGRRLSSWQQSALLTALLALALLPAIFLVWRGMTPEPELNIAQEQGPEPVVSPSRAASFQVNVPVLRLGSLRSSATEPDTILTLATVPEWIVVALEPSAPAEIYRVTLRDPEGEILLNETDIEPDMTGTVRIMVHSSQLVPGDHRLELIAKGSSQDALPLRFAFRVLSAN